MSRHHSYLKSSRQIIASYKHGTPLTFHLKAYFKEHKQIGSRDRKIISAITYQYFRCARLWPSDMDLESAIIHAVFLCSNTSSEFLKTHHPALDEKASSDLATKLIMLGIEDSSLFAHAPWLSKNIDARSFALSMFHQPDLFIRIRPGKQSTVFHQLDAANITYFLESDTCLRLSGAKDLSEVLKVDKDIVVQDKSSQHSLDHFLKETVDQLHPLRVWDACAASGGKSILLHDLLNGNVNITVSDIRKQMLHNLRERFRSAGVSCMGIYEADLSTRSPLAATDLFDVVICDAPCTGSGTWSRTPEQYFSFKESILDEMSQKQSKILANVMHHVKPGGLLIYITCSVFEKENEWQVDKMLGTGSFDTLEVSYCAGYAERADTLFTAVLRKK